jgi:hypothetical protein
MIVIVLPNRINNNNILTNKKKDYGKQIITRDISDKENGNYDAGKSFKTPL